MSQHDRWPEAADEPAGPTGPPEPPPPSGRRRRWAAPVAVVAVLALLATALVALTGGDAGDGADRVPDAPATSADLAPEPDGGAVRDAPPATRAELDATVAELTRFVEGARGLAFERPVRVELLADDAFVARLRSDVEEDRAEIEEDERVLRALRLIDDGVDLFDAYVGLLGAGVVGFYDPESEELVVRGAALTPYVKSTLVHELTHALDDQHFELDRDDLEDADDEREYAYSAVYEGNAVRVEQDWLATRTEAERAEASREEAEFGASVDVGRFPEFLVSIIAFPYLFGGELIGTLASEGGEQAVNAAFESPPTTTEQVLDPSRYLAGEQAVRVEPPPAAGEVVDQGAIGQWVLFLVLQRELGQQRAVEAATGWGGDRYVAWDEADRTCVRARFAMDSAADLGELAAALEDWADAHGGATVDASGDRVGFTACG